MDYHSIHGHDVASFDLPSTHRLPTVSAATALEELDNDPARFISTGIEALDHVLTSERDNAPHDAGKLGGIQRGQVVEIWGPPGSGKTHFGMQLASNALDSGRKVVWIDGLRPVSSNRLQQILSAVPTIPASAPTDAPDGSISSFLKYTCPSLAHFIALLSRPTGASIPHDTSLIVIDSLSALISQAFPKAHDTRNTPKGALGTPARRLQVLQSIISSLQKLAATRDVAIVILSHSATRMQAGRGATLIPAINATSWEQGIATRLVVYRDWTSNDGEVIGIRFAGLQKLNGKAYLEGIGPVFAFDIETKGLKPVDLSIRLPITSGPNSKRKFYQTDFEIADSDDEDYGWDEDPTQMPAMPSQWQGSEDIFLGRHDDNGDRRDESPDVQSTHSDGSNTKQSTTPEDIADESS